MKSFNENELPAKARAAFEAYPELKPTAAFNRSVMERLELEQRQRRTTIIGRIEEFLGLDLWRFAASGMLGALLPTLILGTLYLSNRPSPSFESPVPSSPSIPPQVQSLGQFYARELELRSEFLPSPSRKHSAPFHPVPGDKISCLDSLSHLG